MPLAPARHGSRGPWLVLIHGWSCDQAVWADLVPSLARWARVVTLDLPGHGGSAAPVSDIAMVEMARDVAATLAAMDIADPVLVGHSMGGAVALEAAILLGPGCRSVIGIDTFTDAAFYTRRPADEIAARMESFVADFAGTMTAMVRRITLGGAPGVEGQVARAMAGADPVTALRILEALLEWDITARWPNVSCPVETINSAPLSAGIETVPDLHGLRVHLMDGVGHFPMREDPAGLAALIRQIVRRRA